jgi:hypothetical protein
MFFLLMIGYYRNISADIPTNVGDALSELAELVMEKVTDLQINKKIDEIVDDKALFKALGEGERVLITFNIHKDPLDLKYLDNPRIRGVGKQDVEILCSYIISDHIEPASRYPNLLVDEESSFFMSFEKIGTKLIEYKTVYPFTLTLVSQASEMAKKKDCSN